MKDYKLLLNQSYVSGGIFDPIARVYNDIVVDPGAKPPENGAAPQATPQEQMAWRNLKQEHAETSVGSAQQVQGYDVASSQPVAKAMQHTTRAPF